MHHRAHRYTHFLLSAALACALPAHAENAFTIKVGTFNLTHKKQQIDGGERELKEGGENVYAFAWENRNFEGSAYGAEFLRYDNAWESAGGAQGEATTRVLLATAKRYQETAPNIFPYLGMGLGLVQANVNGVNFDSGIGIALQLAGGVEFRWQAAGIYTELKGLYAETGLVGDKLNSSGIGLFIGATVRF